ncbi:Nif3-like dinuclear metal center hexameric protein [Bacteriovorax stolpii]|uniref:GTP cyclohydrolase 1 type 2 homolog n=1 Tax=Bacteriovorax stolpii TaxID=960 RepID=A0A2K9NSV1_BACTC|nr:Nif3-like dinuclear metal center hexameric protein [Bacteriovorax stolpii]AUN98567.1 Nif3-like dinuclear metal center hexameric protein [Bacteriovorax stolpii]TDP55930.1 dinuclear metal center YbgI/SA1388 family protein [Bacteriovorax stolpii]
MTVERSEFDLFLKTLLKPELFDDYCPNGLQIEGKTGLKKVLFAVSATRESAEYAEKIKADALVVHHGLFWKFHGTRTLTGPFYKRVAPLLKNDINLFAYHLPLDAHPEVGNAKSLAALLEMSELQPFGNYKGAFTGISGALPAEISGSELKHILEKKLSHSVLYSNPSDAKKIKRIGIITGGANSEWREAHKMGLDAYITGEMSEHDYHESRESGIHMFAGGHHATEKFGIQSLMKRIQETYPGLSCEYMDSENPA